MDTNKEIIPTKNILTNKTIASKIPLGYTFLEEVTMLTELKISYSSFHKSSLLVGQYYKPISLSIFNT